MDSVSDALTVDLLELTREVEIFGLGANDSSYDSSCAMLTEDDTYDEPYSVQSVSFETRCVSTITSAESTQDSCGVMNLPEAKDSIDDHHCVSTPAADPASERAPLTVTYPNDGYTGSTIKFETVSLSVSTDTLSADADARAGARRINIAPWHATINRKVSKSAEPEAEICPPLDIPPDIDKCPEPVVL